MPRLPDRIRWALTSRLHGGSGAARKLGVTVGDDCRILSCTVSSEPELVTIGNRVTVSSEVLFVTHDGVGWLFRDDHGRRYRYAPIRIGDDSFIGTRAILMPGVAVGDRCVVAAGAVVTRSVPDGHILGGNPARIIGTYDDLRERVTNTWFHDGDLLRFGSHGGKRSLADREFLPPLPPLSPAP